jgi:DNA-binding XRE family transcriptional regulator
MDKRFKAMTLDEQIAARRRAIEDVLAHPEWTLAQSVRHMRRTMRLTTNELAQLAGLSFRTVQNIEREVWEGTVASVNSLLGLLGLKLGVVRAEDPSI